MTRRELARRAFWSDHPLCKLYATIHQTDTWSLRQLIAFAEGLPDAAFSRLAGYNQGEQTAKTQEY